MRRDLSRLRSALAFHVRGDNDQIGLSYAEFLVQIVDVSQYEKVHLLLLPESSGKRFDPDGAVAVINEAL